MVYDLTNELQAEKYKKRCNALYKKKAVVELTEKFPNRTLSQNAYLHAALSYFALEYGDDEREVVKLTPEEVKIWYFKEHCNPDLFLKRKVDPITGEERKTLKSSSSLDTAEMTLAIDRFREFAAKVGVYIPSPDEHKLVVAMEREVELNKKWLYL